MSFFFLNFISTPYRDSNDKVNWIKAFKKLTEIKFDSLVNKNEIDNFKLIGVSDLRELFLLFSSY